MGGAVAGGQWQVQYCTGLSCDFSCLTSLPTATDNTHQICRWCDSEGTSQWAWEQSCLTGGPSQKGQTGTLSNSTRTYAKSCSLKGIVLCSDMHWAAVVCLLAEEKFWRKKLGVLMQSTLNLNQRQEHPGLLQQELGRLRKILSFSHHSLDICA